MKARSKITGLMLVSFGALTFVSACSSMPGSTESGKEIAARGPTVMNAHAEPSTVELNRELQPFQKPEVLADVKDFGAKVNRVTLKFVHVPIQIPMRNVGGTTWRGELSPQQLKSLAVSGKTIKYDAVVEARDESGHVAVSPSPITVAIKAPELTKATG